jgi:hypothetical protein
VLETFAMTDKPIRFKPMDIYYHMFTGTKYASMKALQQIFDTVLKQPVTPVFTSEYARKVLDWLDTSIYQEPGSNVWVVRNEANLRTVRLPAGKVPDMSNATGVAGYLPGPGGTYVHLTGDGTARFAVIDQSAARPVPYLAEANGMLDHFVRTRNGFSFDLRSHIAPMFRVANAGACRVTKRPVTGSTNAYRQLHVDVACDT